MKRHLVILLNEETVRIKEEEEKGAAYSRVLQVIVVQLKLIWFGLSLIS